MSQLPFVKQELASDATDTERSAGILEEKYKARMIHAISGVEHIVGGSAQSVDTEMIAGLQVAIAKLDASITSLRQAARLSREYARQP